MNALFLIGFAVGIVQIEAQACADSSTNCANYKNNGFCTSTFYTTAQKMANCAATCGMCGPPVAAPVITTPPPAVSGCIDNSATCVAMNLNGFCSSTFYPVEVKAQHCAKTCGLCNLPAPAGQVTTPSAATTTPTTTPPPCSDSAITCTNFAANGFCTNPAFSDAVKKASCAKTCNMC